MKIRLLFAAGGTGGHIFPALAVADKCRELHPDIEIEFVGTRGRLEERVVPRAGYRLNVLWISSYQRKLSLDTLLMPLKIVTSFAQAFSLMSRFRPHAVICAGAYLSYPVGRVAAMRGIPLILMESNALPGRVIRSLAPRAAEIHVAFEATAQHLRSRRITVSGNPVRKIFFEKQDQSSARRHFGLAPDRPTLFAFGGSLGARSINNALDAIIDKLIAAGVQVIWQTGTTYTGGERRDSMLYRSTFIHEMELGYAAADLVLARAGATTIAELAAVGKPSVLVPLPTAADDHQRVNAEVLERAGAAEMVLDRDLAEKLLPTITRLIADPAHLAAMGKNVGAMGVRDADEKIARSILERAQNSK